MHSILYHQTMITQFVVLVLAIKSIEVQHLVPLILFVEIVEELLKVNEKVQTFLLYPIIGNNIGNI